MFTVSELIEELKYLENIGMGERFVKKVDPTGVIILEVKDATPPLPN